MNKESSKIIHTMVEAPGAENSAPESFTVEIDPSLKHESADGILHAFPPILIADPEQMPWPYIRGPKLVPLPDGRWVCVFLTGGPAEPHVENEVMASVSLDGGRTWPKPIRLFKSNLRRCLPASVYSFSGSPGIFVATMIPDSYFLEQRLHLSWYDQESDKWSVPTLVRGCPPVLPMRGFAASDGSAVFPCFWAEGCDQIRPGDLGDVPPQWQTDWAFSDTKREYRQVCGVLVSEDGGETFRVRGYVAHPEVNLWEPTAVEVAPGHYVMLIRAEATGVLYRSETRDSGETWTPPEPTDILNPSTKPVFLKIGDTILLFHNPNPGVGFYKRKQLEVWISRDGLKTWSDKIPLANASRSSRPVCYPDPVYLPESHEVAVLIDTGRKVHMQRIPCDYWNIARPE